MTIFGRLITAAFLTGFQYPEYSPCRIWTPHRR
jgi:hypothetical protein